MVLLGAAGGRFFIKLGPQGCPALCSTAAAPWLFTPLKNPKPPPGCCPFTAKRNPYLAAPHDILALTAYERGDCQTMAREKEKPWIFKNTTSTPTTAM